MVNTYITCFEYARGNSGQEWLSLVGLMARLSGTHAVGATALTLRTATTADLNQYDRIVLFDGSSSEEVTVASDTPMPATSIPLAVGLANAHADGTALCSDGVRGSLSDDIIAASDMLEDQCLQSLFLTTDTDRLSLQTMQASISNDGVLTLHPYYFPVQTVTGIVLNTNLTTYTFDATQASIELGQEVVRFYQLLPIGTPPVGNPFAAGVNQRTKGTITLTYTSGFAYAAMPPRVKKACVLYTSELLAKRRNPSGAAMTQTGRVRIMTATMRDTSGESDLIKEAKMLLKNYTREAI